MEAESPKDIVAKVLGVPNTDDWEILDSNGSLYLAHYTKNADTSRFGEIRGSIVDVDRRVLVANSFGHTPRAPVDEISPDEEGYFSFQTATGENIRAPHDRVFFRRGFEGVMLRIFLHGGQVYASSNRKLFASQSRWGNKSISFLEMYQQLGGQPLDTFYEKGKKYSPLVHVILVVHPDLIDVTKEDIGRGYIAYLNTVQVWDTENPPFPPGEVETTYPPLNLVPLSEAKEGKGFYTPKYLNLKEANEHLRYGFMPPFKDDDQDRRLGTGEFVILYLQNEFGAILRLFRIESTAYSWRLNMRQGEAFFTFRFFQLMDSALIEAGQSEELANKFMRIFPIVPNYDEAMFKEAIKVKPMYFPVGPTDRRVIETRKGREKNIWICYVLAVPPHEQKNVVDLIDVYRDTIEEVTTWIQSLVGVEHISDILNTRAKIILNNAGNRARRSRSRAPMDARIKENIRSLVLAENPSGVYRLQRNKDEIARKSGNKVTRKRI